MDYSELSLLELKYRAKARRIKNYYIRPKAELIRLLSMDELPEMFRVEKMTLKQLRDMAKDRGIKKYSHMKRVDLMPRLFPHLVEETEKEELQEVAVVELKKTA